MKKVLILATLFLLTASAFAANEPAAPTFSADSGVYGSPFSLVLSGNGDIYYTTDGSTPTLMSQRYTGPITVGENSTAVDQWGRDRNSVDIPAGTVIRAAVFSLGQSSKVVTNTYFVGQDFQNYFGGLPIVNLAVTPYDLWDRENGIYSNFEYEHKVPASFQYCNLTGICDINRTIELKVSGHGSRSNPKKSLRVYFKNTDPDQGKYLEYPLIPDNLDRNGNQITTYSKVTFRISDWNYTDLRDVMAQKLGEGSRADTAASTPTALFLNGEFWGMYECREQYDDDYVAAHYGLDSDDIVFLDRDWTLEPMYERLSDTGTVYVDKIEYSSGPKDGNKNGRLGESYYRDQWSYVKSLCLEKDITDPAVYAEFCGAVDTDNFIDYMILYIYAANDDWPGNNFKLWRVTEENIDPSKYGADGKWRFMIHDFDIAFENVRHNTLELSAFGTEPDTEARHPLYATRFISALLQNSDFRSKFAQRTMACLSTRLSETSVAAAAEELVAARIAGKAADLTRWGWGPAEFRINSWKNNTESFASFAAQRKNILINQYIDLMNGRFNAGITGQARVMLSTAVPDGGGEIIYQLSGEPMGTGQNKIYPVFSGIPLTISASADNSDVVITVSHRGETVSGRNEITFTPLANEPYTVTVAKTPATDENTPVLGFARSGRLASMTAGESLPAILIDREGNRLDAEFTVTGGCASVEAHMINALFPGTATLAATYNGSTFYTNITVK